METRKLKFEPLITDIKKNLDINVLNNFLLNDPAKIILSINYWLDKIMAANTEEESNLYKVEVRNLEGLLLQMTSLTSDIFSSVAAEETTTINTVVRTLPKLDAKEIKLKPDDEAPLTKIKEELINELRIHPQSYVPMLTVVRTKLEEYFNDQVEWKTVIDITKEIGEKVSVREYEYTIDVINGKYVYKHNTNELNSTTIVEEKEVENTTVEVPTLKELGDTYKSMFKSGKEKEAYEYVESYLCKANYIPKKDKQVAFEWKSKNINSWLNDIGATIYIAKTVGPIKTKEIKNESNWEKPEFVEKLKNKIHNGGVIWSDDEKYEKMKFAYHNNGMNDDKGKFTYRIVTETNIKELGLVKNTVSFSTGYIPKNDTYPLRVFLYDKPDNPDALKTMSAAINNNFKVFAKAAIASDTDAIGIDFRGEFKIELETAKNELLKAFNAPEKDKALGYSFYAHLIKYFVTYPSISDVVKTLVTLYPQWKNINIEFDIDTALLIIRGEGSKLAEKAIAEMHETDIGLIEHIKDLVPNGIKLIEKNYTMSDLKRWGVKQLLNRQIEGLNKGEPFIDVAKIEEFVENLFKELIKNDKEEDKPEDKVIDTKNQTNKVETLLKQYENDIVELTKNGNSLPNIIRSIRTFLKKQGQNIKLSELYDSVKTLIKEHNPVIWEERQVRINEQNNEKPVEYKVKVENKEDLDSKVKKSDEESTTTVNPTVNVTINPELSKEIVNYTTMDEIYNKCKELHIQEKDELALQVLYHLTHAEQIEGANNWDYKTCKIWFENTIVNADNEPAFIKETIDDEKSPFKTDEEMAEAETVEENETDFDKLTKKLGDTKNATDFKITLNTIFTEYIDDGNLRNLLIESIRKGKGKQSKRVAKTPNDELHKMFSAAKKRAEQYKQNNS